MVTGFGRSPSDELSKAFEQYMGRPHVVNSIQMSANAENRGPVVRYEKSVQESKKAGVTDMAPLYRVQQLLRPMFGKHGIQEPNIGDHPDFVDLKGTDGTAFCPITTLFMDIEGSTRLGLLYPLADVRRIKNAFICMAIELITSFDGHVHRIMGDAVMAYFGGRVASPHGSAIDGLNCAALLRLVAEQLVAPKLAALGFDHEFGIRVGLDYGPKENVLWSSYGYPNSEEVTATSFFVDVAAKLQQAAGRNQIMMGESIKTFLDLPDELLSLRTVTQGGENVPVPFVTPNHTNLDGRPVDYRQFVFGGDRYLRVGALAQNDHKLISLPSTTTQIQPLRVDAEVSEKWRGRIELTYPPCSAPLAKEKWIRFIPRLPFMPRLPYKIRCTVANHGAEACQLAGEDRGNHALLNPSGV